QREHLKEISTDAIDGEVRTFQHEVAVRWELRGNEHRLHAARGFDFGSGALLFLADVYKAVKDNGDKTSEKDRVVDSAGAELDWPEMRMSRSEPLRDPVFASGEF